MQGGRKPEVHHVGHDRLIGAIGRDQGPRHVGAFVVFDEESRVRRAFAPTGRTFAVGQVHWPRIDGGRVIEHWAHRDDLGMAEQLGWIPPSPRYLTRCWLAARRARRGELPGRA